MAKGSLESLPDPLISLELQGRRRVPGVSCACFPPYESREGARELITGLFHESFGRDEPRSRKRV